MISSTLEDLPVAQAICTNLAHRSLRTAKPNAERIGAKSALFLAASLLIAATASSAWAQAYPSRPITVVVPFPAGGPSDVVARIVTDHMAKTLEQAIVIENVGGAGGGLGSARVAAAP